MNKIWLRPASPKKYDVFSAFRNLKTIDWRQSNNYEVGDIVYIYTSKPIQRITHKCRVIKVNIPLDQTIDDNIYSLEKNPKKQLVEKNRYVRLELIEEVKNEVTLNDIQINRLQGPRTITLDQMSIIDK